MRPRPIVKPAEPERIEKARQPKHDIASVPSRARIAVAPAVARIEETACIGCTRCIDACPVDAIVGAAQRMHTVIAAECIGCGLCLPPCPVDCIRMLDSARPLAREARKLRADRARLRVANRKSRLQLERAAPAGTVTAADQKRATVERAMQRARQRLLRRLPPPQR